MSWVIYSTTLGDGGFEFEALALSKAKRSLKSSTPDLFTFEQSLDVTDSPCCVYGDTVVIYNGGVCWFQGICTKANSVATGPAEAWSFEISGGWYWLDVLIFQLNWADATTVGAVYQCSRVVLGYTVDTSTAPPSVVYASIGQTITAIFAYAVSCSEPIQLGACAIAAFSFPMELLGVTCGEAIRRQLKFTPDVVSWTDYSTSPPTINFVSRFTLPSVSLPLTAFGAGGSGLTATPRPDLIPPQVVICYELTNTIGGIPVITISTDASPVGSLGNVPRALVMTIPLNGSKETYVKQRLRTQTIPLNFEDANDPETLQTLGRFWKQFVPDFALADGVAGDPNTPSLVFYPLDSSDPSTYYEITLAQPDGVDGTGAYNLLDPTDTNSTHEYLDLSLMSCLLEGNILPWMEPATKGQIQTIKFRASWTTNNGQTQSGIDTSSGLPGVVCNATFTATNGISQTYHDLQAFETGEHIPTGLAAALAASLAILQYEGSATTQEIEVSGAMALGQTLNVTGGRAEWETMIALLQELSEDIDKGESTAKFGPPRHLNIQDVIEMLRMGRPGDADTRAGGANAQPMLTGLV